MKIKVAFASARRAPGQEYPSFPGPKGGNFGKPLRISATGGAAAAPAGTRTRGPAARLALAFAPAASFPGGQRRDSPGSGSRRSPRSPPPRPVPRLPVPPGPAGLDAAAHLRSHGLRSGDAGGCCCRRGGSSGSPERFCFFLSFLSPPADERGLLPAARRHRPPPVSPPCPGPAPAPPETRLLHQKLSLRVRGSSGPGRAGPPPCPFPRPAGMRLPPAAHADRNTRIPRTPLTQPGSPEGVLSHVLRAALSSSSSSTSPILAPLSPAPPRRPGAGGSLPGAGRGEEIRGGGGFARWEAAAGSLRQVAGSCWEEAGHGSLSWPERSCRLEAAGGEGGVGRQLPQVSEPSPGQPRDT